MANTIDSLIYSARILRNISVVKQSIIDFDPSNGQVSWSEPILIRFGSSTAVGTIAADTITMLDGEVVYATIVVDPKQNFTATITKTSGQIPNSDNVIVLFRRVGSYLWMRDNDVTDGATTLRNISVVKQSLIEFDPMTGDVTWAAPILIKFGSSTAVGTIDPDSITLADGEMAYVEIGADPQSNFTATLVQTSGTIANSDKAIVIFRREGAYLWVRDNDVLDGTTPNDLSGTVLKRRIPISLKEVQGEGYAVLGILRIKPDDYAMPDTTVAFSLIIEAQVNPDALAGKVFFYETTGVPTMLEEFDVISDQTSQQTFAFVPSDPSNELTYEVRAGLDPSSGPYLVNDAITVWHATIEITNTYL
jgi:outer membrane protein assembly factor BamB